MINEIISYKGYQEYINTPSLKMVGGELIKNKSGKHEAPVNMMIYSLYFRGIKAYADTLRGGQSYCHECSHEYRRPVHHYNNGSFNDFRTRWVKYGAALDDIHKYKI